MPRPARPRVLFVLSPIGGGGEVFIEIAAGLKRRGWPAEVLLPLQRAHMLDLGVRARYYEVPPLGPCAPEFERVLRVVPWSYAVFRELKAIERDFDLIFAHLPWGMAILYAHERRRPLVGFADLWHADPWWPDWWPEANPGYVRLNRALAVRTMRACDRVVAPSAFFRDLWAADGVAIDVIRHGRDPSRFRSGGDRARARARLGLPPDARTVLLVGYDFAQKGHHLFAELALRVRDPDVCFVAVGPKFEEFGHWFARDETLGRRLHVRTGVPVQDGPDYFAAADVFLFPTFMESFGLAPVEAMASGVPVVAHRVASIPELIDDGVEGWLVPPGDLDALEARLRALLDDPAKRRAMGEAARARFLREFTEDRMLDEYAACFGRLVGHAT